MNTSFKAVEKKLLGDGWVLVRISGSHYQYRKPGCDKVATIPNHGAKSLSIGVLKNLERITGLSLRG